MNTLGANGQVSRWTNTTGSTFYEFDPHGNVANYNKADGSTTRMGFDAYGQAQATKPSGEVFDIPRCGFFAAPHRGIFVPLHMPGARTSREGHCG